MLKTRVITAFFLIVIFGAAAYYLSTNHWNLLMLAVVAVAAWEWARMSKFAMSLQIGYLSAIVAVGLFLMVVKPQWITLFSTLTSIVALVFWVLLAPILLYTKKQIENKALLALLGLAIILPFGVAMMVLRWIAPDLLITLIIAVSIADSSAYFAGKNFGKHKLAPNISPGKTWEGVAGAFVGVGLYGLIVIMLTRNYSLISALLVVTVFSIVGDLIESLFKRQAGVKDSSSLLPGHGGVLDRIDGLTASLPLALLIISSIGW